MNDSETALIAMLCSINTCGCCATILTSDVKAFCISEISLRNESFTTSPIAFPSARQSKL